MLAEPLVDRYLSHTIPAASPCSSTIDSQSFVFLDKTHITQRNSHGTRSGIPTARTSRLPRLSAQRFFSGARFCSRLILKLTRQSAALRAYRRSGTDLSISRPPERGLASCNARRALAATKGSTVCFSPPDPLAAEGAILPGALTLGSSYPAAHTWQTRQPPWDRRKHAGLLLSLSASRVLPAWARP